MELFNINERGNKVAFRYYGIYFQLCFYCFKKDANYVKCLYQSDKKNMNDKKTAILLKSEAFKNHFICFSNYTNYEILKKITYNTKIIVYTNNSDLKRNEIKSYLAIKKKMIIKSRVDLNLETLEVEFHDKYNEVFTLDFAYINVNNKNINDNDSIRKKIEEKRQFNLEKFNYKKEQTKTMPKIKDLYEFIKNIREFYATIVGLEKYRKIFVDNLFTYIEESFDNLFKSLQLTGDFYEEVDPEALEIFQKYGK